MTIFFTRRSLEMDTTQPNTEPNALPSAYGDWQEWRKSYAEVAGTYKYGAKTRADELYLEIALKRLGFHGINLSAELKYLKNS